MCHTCWPSRSLNVLYMPSFAYVYLTSDLRTNRSSTWAEDQDKESDEDEDEDGNKCFLLSASSLCQCGLTHSQGAGSDLPEGGTMNIRYSIPSFAWVYLTSDLRTNRLWTWAEDKDEESDEEE